MNTCIYNNIYIYTYVYTCKNTHVYIHIYPDTCTIAHLVSTKDPIDKSLKQVPSRKSPTSEASNLSSAAGDWSLAAQSMGFGWVRSVNMT